MTKKDEQGRIIYTSDYICSDCGHKYGNSRKARGVTLHEDTCGVCGMTTWVCHQRSYDWPLSDEEKFVYDDRKEVE